MRQFIPRCMQVSVQVSLQVLLQVLALAGLTALAACSTDIGSINIIPKTDLRPDWLSYSGHKEEFTLREAGAADVVGPDPVQALTGPSHADVHDGRYEP